MNNDPYRYTVVFSTEGNRYKTYAYTRQEARRVARRTLTRNGWNLAAMRDFETDEAIEFYTRVRNQKTGRTIILTARTGG